MQSPDLTSPSLPGQAVLGGASMPAVDGVHPRLPRVADSCLDGLLGTTPVRPSSPMPVVPADSLAPELVRRDAPPPLAVAFWSAVVPAVGSSDRGVAVVLMVAGIAMFGVITASIAAYFVERRAEEDVASRLDQVIERLDTLEARLRADEREGQRS
jgi:hypothetical protein